MALQPQYVPGDKPEIAGAHIKKLSNHPSEDEVLFAAKTYFKVNKIENAANGRTIIHMEEWDAPL